MGVYPDHGVEYIAVGRDGRKLRIAKTSDTDARLLASRYYAERKDAWFKDVNYERCVPIVHDDVVVDIELTERERALLERHADPERPHGWHDVVRIHDTYGSVSTSFGDSLPDAPSPGYYVHLTDGRSIKVGERPELSEKDHCILQSILNVHGDRVRGHAPLGPPPESS